MLKQKAFPSKFPGLSTYLSKAVPKERKSETGFQKRFENTVSRHNEQTQTFFKAHNIECFEEILDKLAREILPQGVVTLFKNDEELILGKVVRDHEGTPEIQFSIVIQQDLSFQLFNGRSSLSLNAVKHIQVGNQIKNVNVLVNILAFMKSMSEKDNYDHDQIHALLNQLKNEINKNNEDSCLQKQLFALEQLQLAPKSTKQKRYSPGLTALAVLWFKTSPCLYKQLRNEGILSLPSIKHVQRLSRALRVESGVSDATVKYLEQRAINLSPREKCVILIMDEMNVAQKLEYFNGRYYGQQEGEFTKTLLGLMIKSLGGKYSDMVALTEISKLNAAKLKVEFMRVMQAVTNCGFDVVATSVDGHIINVKFYKDICKGDLKLSIAHPVSEEVNAKLFLLFDSVHIFKNVLNNFINAREFHLPPFDAREIGVAKFSHLEELYQVECGKPLKMAYKLSETCLHPSSLERTNVKFADAIFHESTVGALRFYGMLDKPAWLSTAAFLEIIRRWFDIVNVKTMSKGYKKKSEFMMPVSKTTQHQLQYLKKFADWLEVWGNMSEKSLTPQTKLAARQVSATTGLQSSLHFS
ncbi:uncharacterized protein LOC131892234 [Tigriopus californicus]|uniref:uncharacterized protein LOC131892234 n=1 Tax=Tigriopus californicus TaxID=6832 RepID=UPI0027D9F9CE|nr:uncharacterized protein LOC131892234 [Tigriopus californicus]